LDPKQDMLKQISAAWETAQRQLADLRAQVERTTELAKSKVAGNFLEKDKDRALRDFGEAVWGLVEKGKLQLPSALSPAIKAMQEIQKKLDAHNAEVMELIKEGDEAAGRMKAARRDVSSKTVAAKGKKR
jgi:hypothetical protein